MHFAFRCAETEQAIDKRFPSRDTFSPYPFKYQRTRGRYFRCQQEPLQLRVISKDRPLSVNFEFPFHRSNPPLFGKQVFH